MARLSQRGGLYALPGPWDRVEPLSGTRRRSGQHSPRALSGRYLRYHSAAYARRGARRGEIPIGKRGERDM